MKVLRKYNQGRRDCYADIKCENCGFEKTLTSAYDDNNYWCNVIPNMKCERCGKSTLDLEIKPESIKTRYSDDKVV